MQGVFLPHIQASWNIIHSNPDKDKALTDDKHLYDHPLKISHILYMEKSIAIDDYKTHQGILCMFGNVCKYRINCGNPYIIYCSKLSVKGQVHTYACFRLWFAQSLK